MDEQLDNDLKDRIREVFDNYEDTPSAADEGWLLLRENFPEEQAKRRGFIWLWWSAAAILLMFLGIGLWEYNKQVKPDNLVIKPLKHIDSKNLAADKKHNNSISKAGQSKGGLLPNDTTTNIAVTKKNTLKTDIQQHNQNTALQKSDLNNAAIKNNAIAKRVDSVNTTHQLAVTKVNNLKKLNGSLQLNQPGIIPKQLLKDTTSRNNLMAKNADSTKTAINKVPQQQIAGAIKPNAQPNSPVINAPKKSIISMFNEDKVVNAPKNTEKDKTDKKIRFAVYAATYFNYAKGSDNQVNVGAGFTSDIKISKNLKLVTGVAIAQNTLNYTGSIVPVSAPSSLLAINNFYKPSATAVAGPAANKAFAVAAVPAPTFKNYNASLVGLDVPLNLKYEFNPQKNDTYISAGVSSGTFINESYTFKYNYPSFFTPSVQQTQGVTDHKNFNNFYFAKTLNVAFGVGYPIGKTNRIVIEPFLKYPLDGLGAQNIRFGAGGLNLKFNFKSPKK